MAIGTTVHKLVLDATQFKEGATLTRTETRAVRSVLKEITPEADKNAAAVDKLSDLYRKGGLTSDQYRMALDKLEQEQRQGIAATNQMAGATGKANASMGQLGGTIGQQIPVVGKFNSLMSLGHPALIGAAVAAGALMVAYKALQGVIGGVSDAMTSLDERAKEARALGETAVSLEGFRLAAGQMAGIDIPKADKALEKFNRSMGEAARGTGAGKTAFESLGLTYQDVAGKSPTEALGIVADRLQDVESASERASIANDLFGRSGTQMLNVLRDGSEGLEGMAEKAELINGRLEEFEIAGVEAANDAIGEAQQAASSLFDRLAVDLAPTIQMLAERFRDLAIASRGFLETAQQAPVYIAAYVGAVEDAIEITAVLARIQSGDFSAWFDVWEATKFDKAAKGAEDATQRIFDAQQKLNVENNLLAMDGNASAADQERIDEIKQQRGILQSADDEATEVAISNAAKRIQALQREIDIADFGADVVEERALRAAGATDAEIASLNELKDIRAEQVAEEEKREAAKQRAEDQAKQQAEAEKAALKEREAGEKAAAKALESLMSPEEKREAERNKRLQEYNDLRARGLLTQQELIDLKANEERKEEELLAKTKEKAKAEKESVGIQAAQKGSAEALLRIEKFRAEAARLKLAPEVQEAADRALPNPFDAGAIDPAANIEKFRAEAARLKLAPEVQEAADRALPNPFDDGADDPVANAAVNELKRLAAGIDVDAIRENAAGTALGFEMNAQDEQAQAFRQRVQPDAQQPVVMQQESPVAVFDAPAGGDGELPVLMTELIDLTRQIARKQFPGQPLRGR